VAAGAQHENTDTSNSDAYKLGVSRTQSLSRSWLQTRYLDYALEDFSVAGQRGSSRLLLFGVDWEFVEGRELSRVRHGRRFDLDIRGASDALGSDTSFLQLRTSAKWVHSLGSRTRLLSHARAGYTIKQKLQALPASVRFFAGGDRSVRGYAYNSLGPVDANGKVIGGSRLLEGGLELEQMVSADWGVAAFADSGSAFSDSNPDFSTGVGLGLRWYSPIGPVRLDFAHPLDGSGRDIRLHIIFGPDL
jgi:translocation and assembly module TamA